MKRQPAPSVPGNTDAQRLDSAVRQMFTVSKEEMQRREADWQKSQEATRNSVTGDLREK
jgi:hypothetical protein